MEREDLLKNCKLYKGIDDNTFDDINVKFIYSSEYTYVKQSIIDKNAMDNFVKEYIRCGLEKFSFTDNVPIELKSTLFIKYEKYVSPSISKFKNWYIENYLPLTKRQFHRVK